MERIKGIIPPAVTPLKGNDELDREGAERLIEHMIAGGVHALFLLGTTGESQSLSYRLRYDYVTQACRQIDGRIPVLVGVSDTSLEESLRLARHAADCGAAGVVATAPYYFAPSQSDLVGYYTALADASPLPVYLYNMPSHVKVFIDASTTVKLADHKNIAGLKDSSANMTYFQTLLHLVGGRDDFSLYMGPEELTGEAVTFGAAGGVNGGANMFPELYVAMYDAAVAGDLAKMKELQQRIMQISTTVYTVGSYLQGLKCALSLLGLCDGYIAWPYRQFGDEGREKIRRVLTEELGCKVKAEP